MGCDLLLWYDDVWGAAPPRFCVIFASLRQITANGRRPAWALKLDVANFFPSIHKATLEAILTRHVHHRELVWLAHTLLWHDPTTNYHFQSREAHVFLGVYPQPSGVMRTRATLRPTA